MKINCEASVKISVIVTVHNAEKYLKECLDSVIRQTFKDIEILCMDGGSTDTSIQILKEYERKDHRIRVIIDPNTSYGHKVNEGIRQAAGEYVSVLESDDMYCRDMLEKLYEKVEEYHADYVNADYFEFRDIDGKRYFSLVKMYEASNYGKLIESWKHPESMVQILRYWTGLFRKEFLVNKKIRMNESPGASFQDMSFRFLTSALADTCYHLDLPVYSYRADNPDSSVHDPRKAAMIVDEFNFLEKELQRREINNIQIWRQFYIWKYNDFYGNLVRFDSVARKTLFERCYTELKKDRKLLLEMQKTNQKICPKSIIDLCGKSKEEVWKDLEEYYQNNRKRENALWDVYRVMKDKKIVIFGCGKRGKTVGQLLYSVYDQIVCYTDNSKEFWYTKFYGLPVLPPEDVTGKYRYALFLVANKYHAEEIVNQLLRLGVEKNNIYVL